MSTLRARIDALAAELLDDQGEDAVTAILIRTRSGRRDGLPAFPDKAIVALRCGDGITLRSPGETIEALTARSIATFEPPMRASVPVLAAIHARDAT